MRRLLLGLLGALLAACPLAAATNLARCDPPTRSPSPCPTRMMLVEKEYKKLMEDDDAAQAEVDQWIRDNDAAAAKGAGVPAPT